MQENIDGESKTCFEWRTCSRSVHIDHLEKIKSRYEQSAFTSWLSYCASRL